MAKPFEVKDDTFQTGVLQSEQPVLVDFWADWCGPCRMIAPSVSAMAEEYDGVLRVAKMGVDENPATPGRYGIIGIPTLIPRFLPPNHQVFVHSENGFLGMGEPCAKAVCRGNRIT